MILSEIYHNFSRDKVNKFLLIKMILYEYITISGHYTPVVGNLGFIFYS